MPHSPAIAVISQACRFADAASPDQLWTNVIEGRRSFRAIPCERLDITRYAADIVGEADSITPIHAGLVTDWHFDCAEFRIPKRSFESTDLTHWLALELAAQAIATIGGVSKLDRARTAVVVANTLAGEFSRASLLRLRAPFLDRLLARSAQHAELEPDTSERLRRNFTSELRRHFPDPNEESLAGGLANTIAGRIANYFDLHGGAYSVDGACASSLVAIADAGNLIMSGQVDTVIVGAVDLSLDPFELIGFSRNGALAEDEMRVFDARSNGFWPGEGGGFAILMREELAVVNGFCPIARLRGWGLSTDGAGGLTRPSPAGQLLAAQRAYEMAVVDPDHVTFVEAHGTGTAVGDPIELRALALLRQGARSPLPVGSIKANIGHTKAAAGFAGFIKAIAALQHGVVPPHVGCSEPHAMFRELGHLVRPAIVPERISGAGLAGVSSFGFGGVNVHVVLEAAPSAVPATLPSAPRRHDAELFVFGGEKDEVLQQIALMERCAHAMSVSGMADAAASLCRSPVRGPMRAAVVASRPNELAQRLARARMAIIEGQQNGAIDEVVFVGGTGAAPRVGFVFPGQAAPSRPDGGLWPYCFSDAVTILQEVPDEAGIDNVAARIAQPAIMAADLAGLALFERLGVRAVVAIGHSLGEIAALAWAGTVDPKQAIKLARRRGEITASDATPGGTMLRVGLSSTEAGALCGVDVVVACENGATETVLAGSRDAIERIASRCEARGVELTRMSVSHAFHSADMAGAISPLRKVLRTIDWRRAERTVVSTVTGDVVDADADLSDLLARQLTAPVRFEAALARASREADLFLEIGPGRGLSRLVRHSGLPCHSIDVFGSSLRPLLTVLAELHVRGCDLDLTPLYEERAIRPFDPVVPSFIASPCGGGHEPVLASAVVSAPLAPNVDQAIAVSSDDPIAVITAVIATETGLPMDSIGADDRFLDRLHLNSLAVTRIVLASAKALGLRAPSAPTEFANVTPRLLCNTLRELGDLPHEPVAQYIGGVRPWVATYAWRWREIDNVPATQANLADWSILKVGDAGEEAISGDGGGRMIWLAVPFTRSLAETLIRLAREAARDGISRFAIVHDDAPVAAFARSLAAEGAFESVRVIAGAALDSSADRIAAALAQGGGRYWECRLTERGGLATPEFGPAQPVFDRAAQLNADDVVLAVGGGRGIAAECALHLGRSGAALVLVGRSKAGEPEVVRTLARARDAGLRCVYLAADTSDGQQLAAAITAGAEAFGPPTMLLHAAGINEPMRLDAIDGEAARRCLMPKMDGLQNAIAACGPSLRRVCSFGSLIGAIGLEGEAHYALANAALSAVAEQWAQAEPGRSSLGLEWSIWAGAGMGERLGTIERLAQSGVDAISVDDALDMFERLMQRGACGTVSVTGRFGPPRDLDLGETHLPSSRFVDRLLLHFPCQEIVIETRLNLGRDPYLEDHVVDGQLIVPGTMVLEAMTQAASCLNEFGPVVVIEEVAFCRAIAIERGGETRIRLAALRSEQGIEVVLLTADDDFAAPAACALFGSADQLELADRGTGLPSSMTGFDAAALYGPLLFNAGRFRRIDRFTLATSREVEASVAASDGQAWFGAFEPQNVALWDPGLADACLHALQVAVPHRRVLPVSAERIEVLRDGIPARVYAVERDAVPGTYVFDIMAHDASGRCLQRWSRVKFKAIGDLDIAPTLAAEPRIAASYLERSVREAFADDSIRIALISEPDSPRPVRRAAALDELGLGDLVERRADGKLIRSDGAGFVSLAHCGGSTIAISAQAVIGCDIELVDAKLHSRGFVIMEACRKLGRRVDAARVEAIPAGRPVQMDGLVLLTVDIASRDGVNMIAFSRATAKPAATGDGHDQERRKHWGRTEKPIYNASVMISENDIVHRAHPNHPA